MKFKKVTKSERLIYIIIFLWIVFGLLGIKYGSNLAQVAGYYASLTLFSSSFLYGEYKRESKSTSIFKKGRSSSREIVIYVTVFLWMVLGLFGIIFGADINQLTVYFTALSPFVSSYIIFKSNKNIDPKDLPVFNGKAQELVDSATESVDMAASTHKKPEKKKEESTEGEESVETKSIENTEVKPKQGENDIEDEDEVF